MRQSSENSVVSRLEDYRIFYVADYQGKIQMDCLHSRVTKKKKNILEYNKI